MFSIFPRYPSPATMKRPYHGLSLNKTTPFGTPDNYITTTPTVLEMNSTFKSSRRVFFAQLMRLNSCRHVSVSSGGGAASHDQHAERARAHMTRISRSRHGAGDVAECGSRTRRTWTAPLSDHQCPCWISIQHTAALQQLARAASEYTPCCAMTISCCVTINPITRVCYNQILRASAVCVTMAIDL